MSTTANRTRGAVPTRVAAAVAALTLLALPAPAGAHGPGRTVLLTLTDGTSLTQLADNVGALGGRVLATLDLSDSLLVELPTGVGAPAGSAVIPDTPMKVNGTQTYYNSTVPTYRETIGAPAGSDRRRGCHGRPGRHRRRRRMADWTSSREARERVRRGPRATASATGPSSPGIIGGRGEFQGVAPRATSLDVQVADAEGNTSLSKVLAGLEAADRGDADVVNISLSTRQPAAPDVRPAGPGAGATLGRGRHGGRCRRQRRPDARDRRAPPAMTRS